MSRATPRILKGFRDYLPETMLPKQRMLDQVARVFESFGFSPLATPALEYADVLLGKYSDDDDKLLYRFLDNGQRDIALRYDLTVPLARVVGMNAHLTKPFKRYQIAPVWRAEKPGRGRFREFLQCDVDIVGSASLMADAECLAVGHAVLERLGVTGFEIRVSNRKLLEGLFDKLSLPRGESGLAVMRTIDKLPKIGEAAVRKFLASEVGLEPGAIDQIFEFLALDSEALPGFFEGVESGADGARELATLIELARAQGISERVRIDLSIARGLDYYTGTIYETFLDDLPAIGSVMSGGRYDRLLAAFSNQALPAVGISLGVDRLFHGLTELELVDGRGSPTEVLVTVFDETTVPFAYQLAQALRASDVPCEVFLGDGRLKKQLQYANRKHIPFAVIAGPDEQARGCVTLKRLSTGEQHTIERDALVSTVKAAMAGGD